LQALLRKNVLGEELFSLFNETADIGDFIELKGSLLLTKKKENWSKPPLASKCI